MDFRKQFKQEHPETTGETDKEFNDSNYIDWLENKLQSYNDNIRLENSKQPNQEQIYCWWINFQWGIAAQNDYLEGLEEGFKRGLKWMIENGYVQVTNKGENYIPLYKM